METQKLTRAQVKEIYDIACPTWQSRIEAYVSKQGIFADFIEFDNEKVVEMFDAAATTQIPVLEKLFKRPVFDLIYNKNLIYLYEGLSSTYKLHRLNNDQYAWISLYTSDLYANGVFNTPDGALNSQAKSKIRVFESRNELINHFKSL